MKKLLAVAAALGLTVTGVVAAPAAEPRRATLRGVTIIEASHSEWLPVRLPRDVDPQASHHDDDTSHLPFEFSGGGRVSSFVLTMEEGEHALGEGPTLIGWSLGRCETKGCEAKGLFSWVISTGPLKQKDGSEFLPAGDYRLYFVQDGAEGKIRMDLDGLTGRTRLSPTNRLTKRVKTITPRNDESVTGESVYWGGRATKISGMGVSILGLWVEGQDGQTTNGQAGLCIYNDPPPDPDTAYVPPCPGADDDYSSPMVSPNNEVGYYNYQELDRGLGVHYTTPTPLKRAGGVAFWLKY